MFSNFTSSTWWISVVVVGIVLNVISFYLLRQLDTYLSRASTQWKRHSERRRQHTATELQRFLSHPEHQFLEIIRFLVDSLLCIFALTGGLAVLLLGAIIQFSSQSAPSLLPKTTDQSFIYAVGTLCLLFAGQVAGRLASRYQDLTQITKMAHTLSTTPITSNMSADQQVTTPTNEPEPDA
jgi:hypothetical protein